jgi:hypothetical protein
MHSVTTFTHLKNITHFCYVFWPAIQLAFVHFSTLLKCTVRNGSK